MIAINSRNRARMFVILIILCLCCIGLAFRVGFIKYKYEDEFKKNVINQLASRDEVIPALRGSILDRNCNVLAQSVKVYNVIFDPGILNTLNKEIQNSTIEKLNEILGISKEELEKLLVEKKDRHYEKIAKKINLELADKIKTEMQNGKIKGVWLEDDCNRNYLYNSLASHAIGFESGGAGHWGVEQTYDKWLQGVSGRKLVVYENGGFESQQYVSPQKGNSLILTIDEIIQNHVENVLDKYVKEQKPKNATVIAMNPKSGEVLALANYPSFNLNDPDDIIYYNNDVDLENIGEKEKSLLLQKVWRNFAVSDTYEPGSTFKPIVIASALEDNIVSVNDLFVCKGYKQLYGHTIHCWKRRGHGTQTLKQALANSCNVAMMEIAGKMGKDIFYKYQREFGIGQKTNIDLIGETSASSLVYTYDKLGPVELATSSFGQGFNLTPIQLITAFSAVVNGGNYYKPYLVKQIVDEQGVVVKENDKQLLRKIISKQTSATLRSYLESVVTEGTGTGAKITGYNIGGKTGTAEKGNRDIQNYVVSFVGFAPVDDPQIIIMTLLDEPKDQASAGKITTEMAHEIFQLVLPYMDIYPENNDNE